MTEYTYKHFKKISAECNADFLPNYNYVWKEKDNCRPSRESILISETEASIALKPLVIHTFDRTLDVPEVRDAIVQCKAAKERDGSDPNAPLKLIGKLKAGNDT